MIPKGQLPMLMNYPLSVLPTMQLNVWTAQKGRQNVNLKRKQIFERHDTTPLVVFENGITIYDAFNVQNVACL